MDVVEVVGGAVELRNPAGGEGSWIGGVEMIGGLEGGLRGCGNSVD